MADADPIVHAVHPATARQAGYVAWTADPAITRLFVVLHDLNAAGARLEELHHERPDLGVGMARGDVGGVVGLDERCPAYSFGHGWRVRANGGACAGLWQLLAARRDAWIEARLDAEGFASFAPSAAKNRRIAALDEEAISVELAWARFRMGILDFTPARDSPRVAAP